MDWPELSAGRDHETLAILQLAAQMLGKLRVAHAPWLNHGWHVALQPNARGLSALPTDAGDGRTFTLTLDLCRHAMVLWVSDGSREEVPLNSGSVAALHRRLIAILDEHGLPSNFNGIPSEIPGAIPFAEDDAPREYDRGSAERFRGVLAAILPVFARFARASAARPARCISGGARSTWRRAASRGEQPRRIRAACPDCPTASRAKPIAMR